MSVWTVLAILLWIALGFALGAAAFTAWHYRLGKKLLSERDPISFGYLLDKECDVLKGDGWHRCKVVAVSHRGAVAVRNATDGSGRHARWIAAEDVPERVRWSGPGLADGSNDTDAGTEST